MDIFFLKERVTRMDIIREEYECNNIQETSCSINQDLK